MSITRRRISLFFSFYDFNSCNKPESRYRKLSLRAERSNLVFKAQIATNPSGSRNDRQVNVM
jgi:hypothetical protein